MEIVQLVLFGYLLIIFMAEWITINFAPRMGILLYSLILEFLLLYALLNRNNDFQREFLGLTVVPLIRLIGYTLPLTGLDRIFWYAVAAGPLLIGGIIIIATLKYSWDDLGLNRRFFGWQMLLAPVGIFFGYALYELRQPAAVGSLSPGMMLVHGVILVVCLGFLEEFLFRGVIQTIAHQFLNDRYIAGIYSAALYTLLHFDYGTPVYISLVFGFALILSWLVALTRSLTGAMVVHGVANVIYFLVLPMVKG